MRLQPDHGANGSMAACHFELMARNAVGMMPGSRSGDWHELSVQALRHVGCERGDFPATFPVDLTSYMAMPALFSSERITFRYTKTKQSASSRVHSPFQKKLY